MPQTLSISSPALESHGPFLRRLALALLRDEASADDAVQETLRRALGSPSAGAIERPRAWLAQIMRHYVSGERRRGAWRDELEDGEGLSIPDATVDPAEITLKLERERVVSDELRALDRSLRDALFLRYYEELSVKGVAEALGITRGAAESRIHRGKEQLRQRLRLRFGAAGGDRDVGWMAALVPIINSPLGRTPRQLIGTGWAVPMVSLVLGLVVGAALWVRYLPQAERSPIAAVQPEQVAALTPPAEEAEARQRSEVTAEVELRLEPGATVALMLTAHENCRCALFAGGKRIEDFTLRVGRSASSVVPSGDLRVRLYRGKEILEEREVRLVTGAEESLAFTLDGAR